MHKTCLEISSEGTSRFCGRSLTLASMCFLLIFMCIFILKHILQNYQLSTKLEKVGWLFSNEGLRPSPMGNNSGQVKMHWRLVRYHLGRFQPNFTQSNLGLWYLISCKNKSAMFRFKRNSKIKMISPKCALFLCLIGLSCLRFALRLCAVDQHSHF